MLVYPSVMDQKKCLLDKLIWIFMAFFLSFLRIWDPQGLNSLMKKFGSSGCIMDTREATVFLTRNVVENWERQLFLLKAAWPSKTRQLRIIVEWRQVVFWRHAVMHDDTWHLHGPPFFFGGGGEWVKLPQQDGRFMCQDTRRQRHQTHSPDLL